MARQLGQKGIVVTVDGRMAQNAQEATDKPSPAEDGPGRTDRKSR